MRLPGFLLRFVSLALALVAVCSAFAQTSGSVIASPEPSTYGSSFVITGTAPGAGQFTFSVDGTVVGTVTSSSNTASVVAPGTFAVGVHTLTLTWSATFNPLGIQFTGTHQVVENPTSLSLLLCVDPPGSQFPCGNPLDDTPLISPITFFFGQSLDGVAVESSSDLGGNIIFYDNADVFCTIPANLSGGSNACPTQSGYFNTGNYTVYAAYTGDSNNQPSTSNSIQVVVYPDTTAASLISSANPAVVGTNITFSMPVTGNFATPTGMVNFYSGSPFSSANLIGTATLDASGTASVSTSSLAVGTYSIYAVYNATSNFAGVQSMITQVITPATTTPPPPTGNGYTLTVTPDPVTIGAGATGILLVTVAGQSSQTPQVTLSCSGLPAEATCIFVTPMLPAGGGATTLQLHVTAPHDCGSNTPYFIGSESGPASPVPYTFAAVFCGTIAICRRRKLSLKRKGSTLLLILIAPVSLASLSGCGHCTDLGTLPGNYTFTVTATPSATSTSGTESVTVPLTVTIP
jgi:Bacterial Ig-like domain (group 3)